MFNSVSENSSEGHCEVKWLDAGALAGRAGKRQVLFCKNITSIFIPQLR